MEQYPSWKANSSSPSQEFPRICGDESFVTVITKTGHLSLSWVKSIHDFHSPAEKFILILHSHFHLGPPGGLFPLGFATKAQHAPLLLPIRATWPAYLSLLYLITQLVFGDDYILLASLICSLLRVLPRPS